MPAATVRVRVRSTRGIDLANYTARLSDPELFAQVAADVVRRRVLPQLKRLAPFRTGALRRSLQVVARGESVVVAGIDYAPDVRWTGPGPNGQTGRQTMPRMAQAVFRRQYGPVVREIQDTLQREAMGG